jgi:hypothetical protein
MDPKSDPLSTGSITESKPSMTVQRRRLLGLPAEIRSRIYAFIFVVDEVILLRINKDGCLYQPRFDEMRAGKLHKNVDLPVQFLRTCSQIYHEATPFLLCHNTIEMLDVDTNKLDKIGLSFPTRMLMTNIRFSNRMDARLNLPAIGNCFPNLKNVNIHTQGTGAPFLILAYELSKSIPYATFRPWPTLELHIQVPVTTAAIAEFKKDAEHGSWYQLTKSFADTNRIRNLFHVNKNMFRLTLFEPYSQQLCHLGAEMPEFSTIALHGALASEYLPALRLYESSYGDCKFKFIREEPMADKQGYTKMIYAWQRKDAGRAAAVRGKDLENIVMLMTQWQPAVGPEFVDAMAKAGLGSS